MFPYDLLAECRFFAWIVKFTFIHEYRRLLEHNQGVCLPQAWILRFTGCAWVLGDNWLLHQLLPQALLHHLYIIYLVHVIFTAMPFDIDISV